MIFNDLSMCRRGMDHLAKYVVVCHVADLIDDGPGNSDGYGSLVLGEMGWGVLAEDSIAREALQPFALREEA